jgi:hypothetical protein
MLHHGRRAAVGNSGPKDTYFKQTTLLLHADGTNGAQNNTFLDSSTNNFTITRNGNTIQGTFTPFSQAAGYWSNFFNSTTDYLQTSVATIGTSDDFTFEAWVYVTEWTNIGAIYKSGEAGNNEYLAIRSSGTQIEYHTTGSPGSYIFSTSLSLNTWNHIAVTRASGSLKCFVNGSQAGSTTSNTTASITSTTLYVGWYISSSGFQFKGYISNFRVVKGTAVYTSAFTPSTTPLTAITNTSLLTCQSNRFVDNSANNFTLTPSGTPSVQPFSPFAPTAAYSTSVNGGSGYFDGSGDYLLTPSTGMPTFAGNFTIGCWVYPFNFSASQILWENGATGGWFEIYLLSGALAGNVGCYFSAGSASLNTTGNLVKANQWNYIAVVRSGSTITVYINGVSGGTYSSSATMGYANSSWGFGAAKAGTTPLTGYMSDLIMIDGSAVTSVPTSPSTAVSGTKMLLSFTNAAIYDNAIKNDLETVGNAQISTSVKKYGTGSLAFDGNGDYLKTPFTQSFEFGTGDFTIEGWLYLNSTSGTQLIVDYWKATNVGWQVWFNAGVLKFYSGSGNLLSGTTSLSTGTWYYFAITRSGTTARLFINGTQEASATSSVDYNTTNKSLWIGAQESAGPTSYFNGYVDDLRLTKGVARYTANFTPPTSAFPNQ